tara:strand:- start:70 stop:459 length:390 start_codon:yes stop_codon:yes gene_type:complete
MKVEDLNKVAQIEKAIAKKYGKDAIANPKSFWTDEKEKEYLEQLKEFYSKKQREKQRTEKVEEEGVLISKNLITRKSNRKCPTCQTFSFDIRDDLYMNKFECCHKCYIQWVEDREERWLKGWRPNKEQK